MADDGNTHDIEVKSFFGATIKEALEEAHQELGPDALLLNAREAPPETLHLGAYEVVLGIAGPGYEEPRKTGRPAPLEACGVPVPNGGAGDAPLCAFDEPRKTDCPAPLEACGVPVPNGGAGDAPLCAFDEPRTTDRPAPLEACGAPAPNGGAGYASLCAFEATAQVPEEMPVAAPAEDSVPESGAVTEDLDALKTFMRTLGTPAYNSLVEESLIEWGVEPQLAHEIDRGVRQRLNRPPVTEITRSSARRTWRHERLAAETTTEIADRLDVRPGIGRTTVLVGPPGMGKTTTLVKLAVVEGLRLHRSVRLISADTQRIGGADQLRTFASILGVPFQTVESAPALALAIDTAAPGEVLLIDTPGCSHAPRRPFDCDLAGFLEHRQDIDTHLVLTASTHIPVLRKLIDTYRAWGPSRLLFTKIDEAESLASVLCEAVRWKMPLSYFGLGPEIPEDLEAANRERVAESLVRRLPCDLQAVS